MYMRYELDHVHYLRTLVRGHTYMVYLCTYINIFVHFDTMQCQSVRFHRARRVEKRSADLIHHTYRKLKLKRNNRGA